MADTERRRVGGDRAETERRGGDRAGSHTAPHTGYSGDRRERHRGLQVRLEPSYKPFYSKLILPFL